jgi:hypothetical protein
MKTSVWLLVFVLCLFASRIQSSESVDQASRDSSKIVALIAEVLTDPRKPVERFPGMWIDSDLQRTPSFRELTTLLTKSNIPAVWKSLPKDQETMVVFLHASKKLAGPKYLELGEAALQSLKEGKLERDVFVLAYLLPNHRKQWFFSSNYRDVGVRDFVQKVKSEFSGDPGVVGWADHVLSGRLAARDKLLFEENPALREGIDLLAGVILEQPKSVSKNDPPRTRHGLTQAKNSKPIPNLDSTDDTSETVPVIVVVILLISAVWLVWLLFKPLTRVTKIKR